MPQALDDRKGRVMFVVPSELSSGEGISVLHMCLVLQDEGHEVMVLASGFTEQFLAPRLGARVRPLTSDVLANGQLWDASVAAFQPDAVVFADYPLLHFSNGIAPLVTPRWLASLESLNAELVTLDHLGYAQREMCVNFGPPHLSVHAECTPVPMERMHILLPCPMNAPDDISSRVGTPFRVYTPSVLNGSKTRRAVRRMYAPDASHLVVHLTPNWAWRIADDRCLPHYPLFDRVLEHLFAGATRPVTVISVNSGTLLAERTSERLTIRNSGQLSHRDFESLLGAADLMLTDNEISSSIGHAAHAGVPVVCLRNSRRLLDITGDGDVTARDLALMMEAARPGAVFPFDVFPIWNASDVASLGIMHDNPVSSCAVHVEMYGGLASSRRVRAVLEDDDTRSSVRARQAAYCERVATLPGCVQALQAILPKHASRFVRA